MDGINIAQATRVLERAALPWAPALEVPEHWQVLFSSLPDFRADQIEVQYARAVLFLSAPPLKLTQEQCLENFGIAYQTSGATLRLITYGAFQIEEGGGAGVEDVIVRVAAGTKVVAYADSPQGPAWNGSWFAHTEPPEGFVRLTAAQPGVDESENFRLSVLQQFQQLRQFLTDLPKEVTHMAKAISAGKDPLASLDELFLAQEGPPPAPKVPPDDPFAELISRQGQSRQTTWIPWAAEMELLIPDDPDWAVQFDAGGSHLELTYLKQFGYGGWVDESHPRFSFENYRDHFGVAGQRRGEVVQLLPFGTFSTFEGGASLRVHLRVPHGTRVTRFALDRDSYGEVRVPPGPPSGYFRVVDQAIAPTPGG